MNFNQYEEQYEIEKKKQFKKKSIRESMSHTHLNLLPEFSENKN